MEKGKLINPLIKLLINIGVFVSIKYTVYMVGIEKIYKLEVDPLVISIPCTIIISIIVFISLWIFHDGYTKTIEQVITYLLKLLLSSLIIILFSILGLKIASVFVIASSILIDTGLIKLIKIYANNEELMKICLIDLREMNKVGLGINIQEIVESSDHNIEKCKFLLKEAIEVKELEIEAEKGTIWGYLRTIKDWYVVNRKENNATGWLIFSGETITRVAYNIAVYKVTEKIVGSIMYLFQAKPDILDVIEVMNAMEKLKERIEKTERLGNQMNNAGCHLNSDVIRMKSDLKDLEIVAIKLMENMEWLNQVAVQSHEVNSSAEDSQELGTELSTEILKKIID